MTDLPLPQDIGSPRPIGHTVVISRQTSGSHTRLDLIYLIKMGFVIPNPRAIIYVADTKHPIRSLCGPVLPNSKT